MTLMDILKRGATKADATASQDVDHAMAAYKRYCAEVEAKMRGDLTKAEKLLTGPFLAGLLIIGPALVFGYIFNLVSSPIKSLLGSASTKLFGLVGISASLAGSAIACLLLFYVLVSAIGALYKYTKTGCKVITSIDALLSHWKPWRAVRKMIKLPHNAAASNGNSPTPPPPDSETRWVSLGDPDFPNYDFYGIHASQGTGDQEYCGLWNLAIPAPTSFGVRWAYKADTFPTGLTFAEVCAVREAGASAPLPDHATLPPRPRPAAGTATAPAAPAAQ